MYRYEIGKPYSANRRQWDEGTQFNWRSNSLILEMFFRHPKPVEIQAMKQGEATFGLVVQHDVLLLVFKFGVIPWSDAAYTWHRVPKNEQTLPSLDLGPEARHLLNIFLIDADTGILLAIRQCSFSHDFTVALLTAIVEQSKRPFDTVAYDRQLRAIYAQYESKALFKLSSITCKGGE